jgi:molybdenum cofactor cytidylyltransferase
MASETKQFSFAVVILAAGSSRRMGQPKLLLPWRDKTILEHHLHLWHSLGASQTAVVHSNQDYLLEALNKISLPHDEILNPHPETGMFESIRCAAHWNGWNVRPSKAEGSLSSSLTHWIICLGDQPHISKETLSTLLSFAKDNPDHAVQPEYAGKPRHPVILPKPLFLKLKASSCKTLKEFLIEHSPSIKLCPIGDAGLELDIDEPSDYEKALAHERNIRT